MVIKKPYAFLIRHFRLIHGLLFIMALFLAIKTFGIYNFFNSYAINHTFVNQTELASNYVSALMFTSDIMVILFLLVIYYLLTVKNKSNKIYLFSIIYYAILFVFFVFMHGVLVGLQTEAISLETIRVYRDINLIFLLPQIVLVFILFGRALGFNIKQFDFKKDLEELEIDVSDSEEVEVTLGNNTYKIARGFRKFLRLTKYFFLENKLFIITFASIFVFSGSIYVFNRINKYQESYQEKQDLEAASLSFNVKESYITNVDMSNNVITEGKHYILVNIKVKNKYFSDYSLNRETFRLEVGKELLLPIFSLQKEFLDLGVTFSPYVMKAGEEKEYIIVYEIDSSDIAKDYLFKIKNYNGINDLVDNYYKEVIIKPKNINNNKESGNYTLPAKIDLKETILGNSSLNLEMFQISDKFKEDYKYKLDGKDVNGVYSIIPVSTNKESLSVLKIVGNVDIDDNVFFSKYINNPSDFFAHYGLIRYRYMGEYKTAKLTKINTNFETSNIAYLEIPKDAENSSKLDLIILIRGIKYTINLK